MGTGVLSPACQGKRAECQVRSDQEAENQNIFVEKTCFEAVDGVSGFAIMVSLPHVFAWGQY